MIEFIAALLTLVSAYYTVKGNILCWPTGIVSTILYIYLLLIEHLYGQIFADIVILAQSIYGWFYWDLTKEDVGHYINKHDYFLHIAIVCVLTVLFGLYFQRYTNNPQPFLDVFTTFLALLANWYLAKKIIQSFITWIITDIGLVLMFVWQHMYWSAGLYIILIGFALQGHIKWVKDLKTD
jgi:nicotinamide mononucleotide transporter